MMKKINKLTLIILFYSLLISQDYSLINISWEPESPNKGEEIAISADVSESDFFKYSYQMNIHLSIDEENYLTYPMSRDYNQGLFVWTYKYNINQDIYFHNHTFF